MFCVKDQSGEMPEKISERGTWTALLAGEEMTSIKVGDPLYWEESNYSGLALVKCIVKTVGKKFCTVVNKDNYEIKFNLETMQDVGRKYGRCNLGDVRYELLFPTDEHNDAYAKQIARLMCINIANELYKFDLKHASDEKIAELAVLLKPVKEAMKK